MRIETEVPGFQLEILTLLFSGHLLDFCNLLNGRWLISINQVVEQFIHMTHVTSHPVLQYIVGIGLVAQQLSHLTAQIYEPLADIEIILRIVVDTLRVLGHIHLPTKLPLSAIGHKGRIAGKVECEHPTVEMLLFGSEGCSLARRLRQSVELSLVGNVQRESLILLQQILRELQPKH